MFRFVLIQLLLDWCFCEPCTVNTVCRYTTTQSDHFYCNPTTTSANLAGCAYYDGYPSQFTVERCPYFYVYATDSGDCSIPSTLPLAPLWAFYPSELGYTFLTTSSAEKATWSQDFIGTLGYCLKSDPNDGNHSPLYRIWAGLLYTLSEQEKQNLLDSWGNAYDEGITCWVRTTPDVPSVSATGAPSRTTIAPSDSTNTPSQHPSHDPSNYPTASPSNYPVVSPTSSPSAPPSSEQTQFPTEPPSSPPSSEQTQPPSSPITTIGRDTRTRRSQSVDVFVVILIVVCSVACVAIVICSLWTLKLKRISEEAKVNMNANQQSNTTSLPTPGASSDQSIMNAKVNPMMGGAATNGVFNVQKETQTATKSTTSNGEEAAVRDWESWRNEEVIEWLLSLQNGKFKQYVDGFVEQRVIGSDLNAIQKNDLMAFGMTVFSHRTEVFNAIQNLTSSEGKISAEAQLFTAGII
eukprot:313807_1